MLLHLDVKTKEPVVLVGSRDHSIRGYNPHTWEQTLQLEQPEAVTALTMLAPPGYYYHY
jgi:hypothetical protein